MATETRPSRAIPGVLDICERCGGKIVWARTVAGPGGPGGKGMPLEPREDPAGNVAAWPIGYRRLLCRVLTKDEDPDVPLEFRAMTHFAICRRPR